MNSSTTFLDQQRTQGDDTADKLISKTFATGQQTILYGLLKLDTIEIKSQPSSFVKKFLVARKKNPVWFDPVRLKNGQHLFKHYAAEIMALLGIMSLPYCYAASPGNKALYLSDKMRNAPGKRLLDTASFVIEVLTPGTLDNETGHIHINKVRLIHALSRYYLKKNSHWNMQWGEPINQEDMAGTNLAFSYIILLGMHQAGFTLSQQEKEDFLFAWRYIGYLLHINEELLPASLQEAQQLEYIIKKRNFKETDEGKILTTELLKYYQTNVTGWQRNLVQAQVRFYVGNPVAEYLGLMPNSVEDRIAATLSDFKSLSNILTVKSSSYPAMLEQHRQLKKIVINR
jgi:hypothetical protein